MLQSHLIKRFAGLMTSPSPYQDAPEGALAVAQDCVLDSHDVLEPRRGHSQVTVLGGVANALAFKQGYLLALTWATSGMTGALKRLTGAGWASLPMTPGGPSLLLTAPGLVGTETRFVSAQQALYFQSAYGLTKIEDISTGVCRAARQPAPWTNQVAYNYASSGCYVVSGAYTGGWLLASGVVGYRFTIARLGANGELIESEPSDRLVYGNGPLSADNPSVRLVVGYMTPPDAVFRIYRTKQVGIGIEPGDECFLVAEVPLTGAPLDANGFVAPQYQTAYVDYTSDSQLVGGALYSNNISGIDGAGQQNVAAPLGSDMSLFRDRAYTLGTSDVQRLTIQVIGTGTGGIQPGSTITVGGQTFTFAATSVGGIYAPQAYTGGTVTANIDNTARELVAKINAVFSSLYLAAGDLTGVVFARYLSSSNTSFGIILLQSLVPGLPQFTVTTSARAGWDRDYTAGKLSDPNAQQAGLSWSKRYQPEAWPLGNNTPIGDTSRPGYRLIPLRDAMLVLKDDGAWAVTDDGSLAGPAITLLDPTVRLFAPRTAVALNNACVALCDQGVMLISAMGKQNISSRPIGDELAQLMAFVGSATMAKVAFAIADETNLRYILCVPESPNATSCTRQYVYHLQTEAWTTWSLPGVTTGAIDPVTRLLYWSLGTGGIWKERHAGDDSDYQDPGTTIASPATTATATLVFSGNYLPGAAGFSIGDLVLQWQSVYALRQRVTGVSYNSVANQTTVTLDAAPKQPWNQLVPLTIIKAIQPIIRFLPSHAGEPLTAKDWGDTYLAFRYFSLDALHVAWSSDLYQLPDVAPEQVANYSAVQTGSNQPPIALVTWASDAWGSALWGRQTRDVVLKVTRPNEMNYSSLLQLELRLPCALQRFELAAVDHKITGATDRAVR
jgi:hypothetical protein